MDKIVTNNPNLLNRHRERSIYLSWVRATRYPIEDAEIEQMKTEYLANESFFGMDFQNRILEQASIFFLIQNNFKEANKWNRKILQLTNKRKITAFSKRAELRNIYIHFKRDRIDNMDKSIQRFINSKNFFSYF